MNTATENCYTTIDTTLDGEVAEHYIISGQTIYRCVLPDCDGVHHYCVPCGR